MDRDRKGVLNPAHLKGVKGFIESKFVEAVACPCHRFFSGPAEAITYEEFADLIYGPRLAVGDSPQEAQDGPTGMVCARWI